MVDRKIKFKEFLMAKKLTAIIVLFLVSTLSSSLFAAQPQNTGPDMIKLKMGKKTLDFTHRKHQKLTNNQCWECHDKNNGKIPKWGEPTAHKLCIPCHDLNEKGPINCKECHKKK
jgi:predicted CXXCH cytochrome family protein